MKYKSIITNRGAELNTEAVATGNKLKLTSFALTDGNGKAFEPDATQTKLAGERYRGEIGQLVISQENPNQLVAILPVPEKVGGFTIRGAALLTENGETYAVCNMAAIEKPEIGMAITIQFHLAASAQAVVNISTSTGTGLFLRVSEDLGEISAKGQPSRARARANLGLGGLAILNKIPDATTKTPGQVQLSSSVDSIVENLAATPKAVKIAMDNANQRLAKDRNGSDIPNIKLFKQNIDLDKVGNFLALPLAGGVMQGVIEGYYGEANAWAEQYRTKAPLYHINQTNGGDEYTPIIKQLTQTPKASWAISSGTLSAGNFLNWALHFKGSAGHDTRYQWDQDGNYTNPGKVTPGNYANFDERYLTKQAAQEMFVSGVRLGVERYYDPEAKHPNNRPEDYLDGLVLSDVRLNSWRGSDRGSYSYSIDLYYRPIQINVNGTWLTISNINR